MPADMGRTRHGRVAPPRHSRPLKERAWAPNQGLLKHGSAKPALAQGKLIANGAKQ